ncbi:MAG: YhfC family intramembrane metalloprotease [Anaerolineae bacterium]
MQTAVIVAWAVAVLIEIGFPIALAIWFKKRYGVNWRVFLYGALVFLVFQMILRIPAVQVISQMLAPQITASQSATLLYLVSLAITAGLFESVGRWVGYRWLFRRRESYTWRNGVAFGIGHGGFESMFLVGLNSLLGLVQAIQITSASVEQLQQLYPEAISQVLVAREQYLSFTGLEPLWGGIERLLTIPFHIALSLLVLLVFTRKQGRWFWAALGLHALVDFLAVFLSQIAGWPVWAIELAIALFAAFSVWIILRLRGEGESEPQTPTALAEDVPVM